YVNVDRDTAARLGVNLRDVDNDLYDSFGQRQVANIYEDLNQYTVVMETAPEFSRSPDSLPNVYVPAAGAASTTATAAGTTAARQTATQLAAQAQTASQTSGAAAVAS